VSGPSTPPQGSIVARDLAKTYGGSVRAVDGISFEVHPGEIFGFLGPNGAGKTTTVSMLTAGLGATSGQAFVDGLDVVRNPLAVKRRIGIVFQEMTSDGDLTGRENIELAADLYAVPRAEVRSRSEALMERMQIGDAADRLAKTYSGGMRRRLELAAGIVHSPSILFLDEPTLGLDPQGRAGFWKFVDELRHEHRMTVFVTTHYLEEADGMCERVAIIDHGKIVAVGTPGELKDRLGGDVVTVQPAQPSPALEGLLRGLPGVTGVVVLDGTYRMKSPSGEKLVPSLVEACVRGGVGLTSVSVKRPSLDEVFLEFTGREFREDEGASATDRAVMFARVRSQLGGRR
jgi:ABC-2 type transport system ATP-binding protein